MPKLLDVSLSFTFAAHLTIGTSIVRPGPAAWREESGELRDALLSDPLPPACMGSPASPVSLLLCCTIPSALAARSVALQQVQHLKFAWKACDFEMISYSCPMQPSRASRLQLLMIARHAHRRRVRRCLALMGSWLSGFSSARRSATYNREQVASSPCAANITRIAA